MKCLACGSEDLEWFCHPKKLNAIVDGRLKINEIGVEFYLGCNYCSETIKVIDGDEITNFLNQNRIFQF